STRESELEKLIDVHPIVEEILNYRELQKLLSTYIDNIPTMVDANNRLHSHLNQAGTTTGRMSSNNPNLQNIPAREGLGAAIRNGFVASPGYKLVSFDYSQIEMRVLAELSGDGDLVKIFQEGKDVHTAVASRVFQVSEKEVTKDMRRQAKVINFGIIYGMGVNALRANLGSSREDAQKFYDDYFAAFPTIRAYFDRVKDDAARSGYTLTFFGRRRYFPGIKSRLPFLRASAERMAMNAPLQGTAADVVKIAMREADQIIVSGRYSKQASLLLQIHDELVFEIKDNLVDEIVPIIKKTMENCVSFKVPLVTNVGVGQRWGELKA
ncbi:MAG: DNA polymerase, partial [bacterium]